MMRSSSDQLCTLLGVNCSPVLICQILRAIYNSCIFYTDTRWADFLLTYSGAPCWHGNMSWFRILFQHWLCSKLTLKAQNWFYQLSRCCPVVWYCSREWFRHAFVHLCSLQNSHMTFRHTEVCPPPPPPHTHYSKRAQGWFSLVLSTSPGTY